MTRLRAAMTNHPVLSAVAVVGSVVALVVSELIGLFIAVTAVLLAVVGVVAALLVRWRSRGQSPARPALVVGATAVAAVVVAVGIQAVPYGRAHSNPPVVGEPAWATPQTRELVVRACYACHSNEVEYPAYASVAPVSWAVQRHVEQGRAAVNYSEFTVDPGDADESVEVVVDGSMPPGYFTRFGLHPEARLTPAERDALLAGLRATPGLGGDADGDDADGDD